MYIKKLICEIFDVKKDLELFHNCCKAGFLKLLDMCTTKLIFILLPCRQVTNIALTFKIAELY